MAKRPFGFGDEPRRGITRYVVWTVVGCLALGAFLYADGYFDDMIEETPIAPAKPAGGG